MSNHCILCLHTIKYIQCTKVVSSFLYYSLSTQYPKATYPTEGHVGSSDLAGRNAGVWWMGFLQAQRHWHDALDAGQDEHDVHCVPRRLSRVASAASLPGLRSDLLRGVHFLPGRGSCCGHRRDHEPCMRRLLRPRRFTRALTRVGTPDPRSFGGRPCGTSECALGS